MNRRITHRDAIGVLNSWKSITEAARDIGEDEVCETAIGLCEPKIATSWRILRSGQMIAEACSDSEKNIRHDIVVKLVRNGDLGYEKKRVRPGCFDLLTERDECVSDQIGRAHA